MDRIYKTLGTISIMAAVLCSCAGTNGSVLTTKAQDLYWGDSQIDLWGVELPAVVRSDELTDDLISNFRVFPVCGVNTIGISLQSPGCNPFSSDGRKLDRDVRRRVSQVVLAARNWNMQAVVTLFSGSEESRLKGPEAYRRAAESVARFLRFRSNAVVVAGIPPARLSEDISLDGPLAQPNELRDLCGTVNRAGRMTVPGVSAAKIEDLIAVGRSDDAEVLIISGDKLAGHVDRIRAAGIDKPIVCVIDAAEQTPDLMTYVGNTRGLNILGSFSLPAPAPRGGSCILGGTRGFSEEASIDWDAIKRFGEEIERARLATSIRETRPVSPTARQDVLTEDERRDGWIPLFDGETFNGWSSLGPDWGGWSAGNGIMRCVGGQGRWLRSVERYDNFVLRFESKLSPGCNSGVFIRAPLEGRASRIGFEIQMLDDKGRPPNRNSMASVYDILAPRVSAARPVGEWNSFEVTCDGPHLVIVLNGQTIHDVNYDEVPRLKERLRVGRIGLQDHGHLVEFRKIRLKRLGT